MANGITNTEAFIIISIASRIPVTTHIIGQSMNTSKKLSTFEDSSIELQHLQVKLSLLLKLPPQQLPPHQL